MNKQIKSALSLIALIFVIALLFAFLNNSGSINDTAKRIASDFVDFSVQIILLTLGIMLIVYLVKKPK